MTLTQKGYWEILRKQLTLKGTWNSSYNDVRNEWRTALAAMRVAPHRRASAHLARFPLSEADKAFGVMRERKEFFNKVMFINGSITGREVAAPFPTAGGGQHFRRKRSPAAPV